MPMRRSRGFTVIEVLIVVLIIGVLAAIALPAYQDYSKRARMSEVVLAASACRTTITDVFQSASASSPGANAWGCESGPPASQPAPSRYVRQVATSAEGAVLVTTQGLDDPALDGKVVTLVPLSAASTPATFATSAGKPLFGWRCGSPADGTTVPSKMLPSSCRG